MIKWERGEKTGRNKGTDERNRRHTASKLCEISVGGHIEYHNVCGTLLADTLGDLVVYEKNRKEFFAKELGIEQIPSKATFGRVLSTIDGKEIGNAIVDLLRTRFGNTGKVVAVDGKAI